MKDITDTECIEFRPRDSAGRYWTAGTGLLTLALCIGPILPVLDELHAAIAITIVLIGLAISGPLLLAAWRFPTMKYELGPDTLTLRFRPFMNDQIPLASIESVRIKERLRISLWSSFRFPGLAIMDVHYPEENRVRMCATSTSKRILLIDANGKRYGITPDDERGFLDALQGRLGSRVAIETAVDDGLPTYSGATRQ